MTDVPTGATDYRAEDVVLIKSRCLTVAAKLGGLMDDIVVVGGYVPTLLIDLARPGRRRRKRRTAKTPRLRFRCMHHPRSGARI